MTADDEGAERRYRLDPTLDFMRLLWSIEHGLQKKSKRMKAEAGITGPQRLVLRIVSQHPGISAGDLARLMQLHPSTVTGILQRLVAARLLRRARDPVDNRRVSLWTTPRAARHARPSSRTVESTVRSVLQRASSSELTGARLLLAKLARRLNE
jgi:MarR family transcriptional regulator, organic hydroperoxide resistance regulator